MSEPTPDAEEDSGQTTPAPETETPAAEPEAPSEGTQEPEPMPDASSEPMASPDPFGEPTPPTHDEIGVTVSDANDPGIFASATTETLPAETSAEAESVPEDTAPPSIRYVAHPETVAHLERNFSYHELQGDQVERYQQICDGAKALASLILECSPQSREQLLALTKLDEVVTWSREAIARNEAAG